MSATLRQLKSRIKSVENTKKITKAMQMVSASKLNRVKSVFYASKSYLTSIETLMKDLLSDVELPEHPLLNKRPEVKNVCLCVFTSDAGLCSTYNSNVIKSAELFLKGRDPRSVRIIAVGKEGYSHFKKNGYEIHSSHLGVSGRYSSKLSDELRDELVGIFTSGRTDEVYIAYTHFSASLRHTPVVEKFLNIECASSAGKKMYIFEPGREFILNRLLARYLWGTINLIVLETLTAENSARMLAMKIATDNAEELIGTLTLMRNKARQYAITKEVLEIAMSAEALKG